VLPDAKRHHVPVLLRQHGGAHVGSDDGNTDGIPVDEPDRQPVAVTELDADAEPNAGDVRRRREGGARNVRRLWW
jgi:hypothetical protein